MQGPAHFVVGVAICRYVKWRPVGLVLAFGSHFVLDALPHLEDPSILPGRMAHFVGQLWVWLLLGLAATLVPLGWMVWRRFGGGRQGAWLAVYLIAGGALACFPDYVTEVFGRDNLIGQWNSASHQTWFPLYYRWLFEYRPWRPLIALVCLMSEAAVLVGGLWLGFRRFGGGNMQDIGTSRGGPSADRPADGKTGAACHGR